MIVTFFGEFLKISTSWKMLQLLFFAYFTPATYYEHLCKVLYQNSHGNQSCHYLNERYNFDLILYA